MPRICLQREEGRHSGALQEVYLLGWHRDHQSSALLLRHHGIRQHHLPGIGRQMPMQEECGRKAMRQMRSRILRIQSSGKG